MRVNNEANLQLLPDFTLLYTQTHSVSLDLVHLLNTYRQMLWITHMHIDFNAETVSFC